MRRSYIFLLSLSACWRQDWKHGMTWVVKGDPPPLAWQNIAYRVQELNDAFGCQGVSLAKGDCDGDTQSCIELVPSSHLELIRRTHVHAAGQCDYGWPEDTILIDEGQRHFWLGLIALHELGHAFGLGHTAGTLMDAGGTDGMKTGSAQEIRGLIEQLARMIEAQGFSCAQLSAPDRTNEYIEIPPDQWTDSQ